MRMSLMDLSICRVSLPTETAVISKEVRISVMAGLVPDFGKTLHPATIIQGYT